jgi:hypothetical protein
MLDFVRSERLHQAVDNLDFQFAAQLLREDLARRHNAPASPAAAPALDPA